MRNAMDRLLTAALRPALTIACLATLTLAFDAALANWPAGGEPITSVPGGQEGAHLVSDGAGGAIIGWLDRRTDDRHLYLQRVDGAGNPMWAENGIALPNTGDIIEMLPDGDCGVIIVWLESGDLWAARVDHSGSILWIAADSDLQASVYTLAEAVSDGTGGVIVAWNDDGNQDIYAQRIDGSGSVNWTAGGVLVGTAGPLAAMAIAPDRACGAVVCYSTEEVLPGGLYVQRVYGSSGTTWSASGTMIDETYPELLEISIDTDAYGNAWVAYTDGTISDTDIVVQKIDPAGNPRFVSGMVPWSLAVCDDPSRQCAPDVMCDGMGGAYVVWLDERASFGLDIWAQRIDAWGVTLWTDDGVPVLTDPDNAPADPEFLGLYDAHLLVGWSDERETGLVCAQKLDFGGSPLWADNGVTVLDGDVTSLGYDVMADPSGSVFAATSKYLPAADTEIFAIAINNFGTVAAPAPDIISVMDIPDDQGGKVRLTLAASDRDAPTSPLVPVGHYNVWQRIDDPVASGYTGGLPEGDDPSDSGSIGRLDERGVPDFRAFEIGTRKVLSSSARGAFPVGTWEFIGSFAAVHDSTYYFRASTLADSTAAGTEMQTYVVSAHTEDPAVWFVGAQGSGYSVDNLAPAPPLGLAGEQSYAPAGLQLTWDPNTENDLGHYAVYRGTDGTPDPATADLLDTPQTSEYFDASWSWDVGYWYLVTAVDVHGNESDHATLYAEEVTGEGQEAVPDVTFLARNYPNPFNPNTTIAFGLEESGFVNLRVYDAAGQLVAVLIDESRKAGRYTATWDGKGRGGTVAASGVYFCRLTTQEFAETRKMILLR